jgi:hypothetical protein
MYGYLARTLVVFNLITIIKSGGLFIGQAFLYVIDNVDTFTIGSFQMKINDGLLHVSATFDLYDVHCQVFDCTQLA